MLRRATVVAPAAATVRACKPGLLTTGFAHPSMTAVCGLPRAACDEAVGGAPGSRWASTASAATVTADAAEAAAAQRKRRDSNPYFIKTTYPPVTVHGAGTAKRHWLDLDYYDVGALWSFGDAAAVNKAFPSRLPGDLATHFAVTGSNALLVRPTTVQLVHHLELWRQVTARAAAAGGERVLDVADVRGAYTPLLPPGGSPPAWLPASDEADIPLSRTQRRSAAAKGGVVVGGGGVEDAAWSKSLGAYIAPTHLPSPDPATRVWDPSAMTPSPFRMLTGPLGVGKTAVLASIIAYARSSGWLTVYVPSAFDIMHKGLVLSKSRRRPGFVDQHDVALTLLQSTLSGQGDMLAKLPQRGTYAKFRYLPRALDGKVSVERDRLRGVEEEERSRLRAQAESEGKVWDPAAYKSKADDETDTAVDRTPFTLRDMVEWGISHPTEATDTLVDLLQELRRVTEYPVLIAIDGFNHLYEPSPYPSDGALVPPERLSVPHALRCMGPEGFHASTHSMKRGLVVSTVDQAATKQMALFKVANVPMASRIRIPNLTRIETASLLQQFQQSGKFFMLGEGVVTDAFAVEYYRMLTGGLAQEVFKAALYQPGPHATWATKKASRDLMR